MTDPSTPNRPDDDDRPFGADKSSGSTGRGGDAGSGAGSGKSGKGGSGSGPRTIKKTGDRDGRGPFLPFMIAVVVGIIVLSWLSGFWINWLWFDSVGYTSVLRTQLLTQVGLFVISFALAYAVIWGAMWSAYKFRPLIIPTTPGEQVLAQYRRVLEPMRKLATILVPAFFALLAGSTITSSWQEFLLWRNSKTFGTKDAQFGLDAGFYVFTLPWFQDIVGYLTMVLILGLLAGVATNYVYGGLQLPGRGQTTSATFIQLGSLAAALFLVRGASYWLDRYAALFEPSSLLTGVRYVDDNAVLPGRAILAVAAVICALLFIPAMRTRSWRLPIVAVVVLTGMAVVVGGIYPAVIQSVRVNPSQQSLEAPYIERNIVATRTAFGIDDVQAATYAATTDASPTTLRSDAQNIPGIRIMDPNVISDSFKQTQAVRPFYTFQDTLDVDRYTIDGKVQDAVVAARELSLAGVPAAQRNWVNDHTVYTHGYGVVAAYGNRRSAKGDMVPMMSGFSDTDPDDKKYEPRIYFGEISPEYSIVGAPEGANPREYDYPSGTTGDAQTNTTYSGNGGVSLSNPLVRLAYTINYQEPNFLLSDAVTSSSRILDRRSPRDRVQAAAPWLQLDGNAYPAIVDGRVLWIVDAYTTTAKFPSSRLVDLGNATSDSVTEASAAVQSQRSIKANYVRNSVKATVDAFDGSVKLYAWDDEDPILKSWMGAFPGTVKPMSEMSGELMAHVRYPQDLLKVQRVMLTRYHITDPAAFYSGNDFWAVPKDPTHDSQDQPTYYQSIAMPGQKSPTFSLTSTFVPTGGGSQNVQVLRGFLAADGDAGTTDGQRSKNYGTLRMLALPSASAVPGPGQVENKIESAAIPSQNPAQRLDLRQFIAQNRGSGATFTFGNLLTLPIGGGLLYVQPLYVQQSKTGGSSPLNVATVAVFGDKIGWGDTLNQALDGVFGTEGGTGNDDPSTSGGSGGSGGGGGGGTTGTNTSELATAVAQAQKAYNDGQTALKAGDFAAYGEAQERLNQALKTIQSLVPSGTATPTPTPTPSATP